MTILSLGKIMKNSSLVDLGTFPSHLYVRNCTCAPIYVKCYSIYDEFIDGLFKHHDGYEHMLRPDYMMTGSELDIIPYTTRIEIRNPYDIEIYSFDVYVQNKFFDKYLITRKEDIIYVRDRD